MSRTRCLATLLVTATAFWPAAGAADDAELRRQRDLATTTPADRPQVIEALRAACARGQIEGCADLTYAVKYLAVSDAVRTRGADVLWRRCHTAGAEACSHLGDDLVRGGGIVGEPIRRKVALRALTWACARREVAACLMLSDVFLDGDEATTAAPRTGVAYAQRACDLGDAASCATLSGWYAVGQHVPRSPRRAAQLQRKACRGGHSAACHAIDEIACTGGDRGACARLAAVVTGTCRQLEERTCADRIEHIGSGGVDCAQHAPCARQASAQRSKLAGLARRRAAACANHLGVDSVDTWASVKVAATGYVLELRFEQGLPPDLETCLRALATVRMPAAFVANDHRVLFRGRRT